MTSTYAYSASLPPAPGLRAPPGLRVAPGMRLACAGLRTPDKVLDVAESRSSGAALKDWPAFVVDDGVLGDVGVAAALGFNR